MDTPIRRLTCLALAAAIAGWVLTGVSVFGGDDDDLTDGEPPTVIDNDRGLVNPNPPQNGDVWKRRNARGDQDYQRLNWLLSQRVLDVAHSARLTENQKQKLLLAGQGDLERFDDRIAEIKARYRSVPLTDKVEQEMELENRRTALGLRGGVFTGDSLFVKTLKKTLTAEQFARYQKADQKRREFQHRAGVHMTVLRLSTALGLSDDQWKRFEQVLLAETRPAQIIGRPYAAAYFNIVYVQMRRIPDEKLKPLFEPWQWRTLQRKLVEAAHFGGGFENNGIFLDPAEEPTDAVERARQNFLKQVEIHP